MTLNERSRWKSAPNVPSASAEAATELSMNCSSDGTILKNEMLIVEPGESVGKRWPKRSATWAICSPLSTTEHSPLP